jgi:hypothetical protein
MFRSRLGDAVAAVHGLDHGVAGGGEKIAQDGAQIFLVLDDEDALAHGARVARSTCRAPSRFGP